MRHRNRSPWKRALASPVSLVILLLLFGFMARAAWSVYSRSSDGSEKVAEAMAALDALKARKDELEQKVAYLSTDEGVESEIRSKFRAVAEGELVAVIIDESPSSTDTELRTVPVVLPWWRKVLKALKFW